MFNNNSDLVDQELVRSSLIKGAHTPILGKESDPCCLLEIPNDRVHSACQSTNHL